MVWHFELWVFIFCNCILLLLVVHFFFHYNYFCFTRCKVRFASSTGRTASSPARTTISGGMCFWTMATRWRSSRGISPWSRYFHKYYITDVTYRKVVVWKDVGNLCGIQTTRRKDALEKNVSTDSCAYMCSW